MQAIGPKPPPPKFFDLLKLCLARRAVFCFLQPTELRVSGSDQLLLRSLRNAPKLPTCLTSLLCELLLRTAGPMTWAKALPCTLQHRVLFLLLPSSVSFLLTYKSEGTEGNKGNFFSLHSDGGLPHGSSSSSSQAWLRHTRTHTKETWDQAPSLTSLYHPTTNQCK
jgi:hypothetical protein